MKLGFSTRSHVRLIIKGEYLMETAVIERRQSTREMQPFWDELNLAQKFSVAELQRFGYELSFVRHVTSGSMAVLRAGNKFAAINHEGEINTAPDISIRH